ncbi:tryptophan dimethylallyltransferase-domain-containing protein [Xylariaceae sp. FL1272]|nr:tryptophan dimethylallyltransferase-domain-containing protein [Xylariaceae sp. FL1272]
MSNFKVLSDALQGAPYCTEQNMGAFKVFSQFASEDANKNIEYEMLAIEMIDVHKSHIMTLGGRVDNPKLHEGLEKLHSLWTEFFGHSISRADPLRENTLRTAGILYNVEFALGDQLPTAKIYIPVRHYAASDDAVTGVLAEYLQSNQRGKYVMAYRNTMTEMFGHKQLAAKVGAHTYIGCTPRPNGDLRVVSYFKPPSVWGVHSR